MNHLKSSILTAALALVTLSSANAQTVITAWDFESQSLTPSTGSGTASLLNTTSIAAAGSFGAGFGSGLNSLGTGWGMSGFPGQSTASGTEGVSFSVATTGFTASDYTGLLIKFDHRVSNTASRWYQLDYTIDGTNWALGAPSLLGTSGSSAGDVWGTYQSTINSAAVLNNSNFGFRITSVYSPNAFTQVSGNISYLANTAYEVARNGQSGGASSAYAATGTWRFDNVSVSAVPEPSSATLLGLGFLALIGLRRLSRKS